MSDNVKRARDSARAWMTNGLAPTGYPEAVLADFEAAIRADEREACAKAAKDAPWDHDPFVTRRNSVEAIRARGTP